VFGFLGGGKTFSVGVAPVPGSDTTNGLYQLLKSSPALKWTHVDDTTQANKMLSEGDISALVEVKENPEGHEPRYSIQLHSATSQMDKLQQLQAIIRGMLQNSDPVIRQRTEALAEIDVEVATIREFKSIDFILPGQLGFSLLAGSVFGTAFIFFSLRETLVLKRFFSTPVRREVIVLSEGIARMVFQLLGAIVIITAGYFIFDYTLVNGFVTFIEMILLCALGILVFMGFGFIISGLAKNQTTIPPLSNLVTLPQFLLAGTFFPIDVFPSWLQPFCKILPLTYLNDALRKVAFDNAGLWELRIDILVLMVWAVVLYIVAGKVFKWE
ncbi:MAG: ABC transporter permease, partial [Chitinophagaceae bacterium]|nr:ABC transporter permease [Chitinophagaceae bacterium]